MIKKILIVLLLTFCVLNFYVYAGADIDLSATPGKKILTVFKVKMDNPKGDPVATPVDNQNEFIFTNTAAGTNGKLEINCKASITPTSVESKVKDLIQWNIDAVGGSALTWSVPWITGSTKGKGKNTKATFTGLPTKNSDFGKKKVEIKFINLSSKLLYTPPANSNKTTIEVFYTGQAFNHPGGVTTDPNWFHYYKQNEGGGTYKYKSVGRSTSTSAGGEGTVKIGNEAYLGDQYVTTIMDTGPGGTGYLKATGLSGTNYYYANFLGVLAHEMQHATNEISPAGGATDPDTDWLTTNFENNTSKTNPNDKYSAGAAVWGNLYTDDEIYADGPVEENGVNSANTSNDWAEPGTNKGP